jgi:tetratricopeptide (TPR) repeat protein
MSQPSPASEPREPSASALDDLVVECLDRMECEGDSALIASGRDARADELLPRAFDAFASSVGAGSIDVADLLGERGLDPPRELPGRADLEPSGAERAAAWSARRRRAVETRRAYPRGPMGGQNFGAPPPSDWLQRFDPTRAADAARLAADEPASDPAALLARARARTRLGRDEDARADLLACADALGDEARVELAFLDVRGRGGVEAAADELSTIAGRAGVGTVLEARALHVLGLARGKLRQTALATDALLRATECFRSLGDAASIAQVQDTLGSLFAAQGRIEFAATHYAASIVGKLRAGDVAGIALTLGNLGRLHLRVGRFLEAIDCFRLDLDLARDLGDERATARMREDIGRAWMGLERWDDARVELRAALEIAREHGYRDIEFFALHDLALTDLALGDIAAARGRLARAEASLGPADPRDTFLDAMLASARGRVLAADRDDGALPLLQSSCERFARLELPDHEIPARVALAEARLDAGDHPAAEHELRRALELARLDGYARYLPQVRESMSRLRVVESAVDERGRLGAPGASPAGADGYILLARLGRGTYGEVWRAYDPQRAQVVALKRFALGRLYRPDKREHVLASARTELATASRLRHPGVARVFALGTDDADGAYVVQEFIDGPTLRSRMDAATPDSPGQVLAQAGRIARALQTLHAGGVVHRDLKPENVLLRRPGEMPVLIDFGLALVPDGELDPELVAGTLAYMAPEQAAGQRIGGEADLYALGAILYEWFSGRRPLRLIAGDLDASLDALQRATPIPIAGLRPDLGLECTDLIDALLRKDPTERPRAEEVAEHCEEWAGKSSGWA